MSAQPSGRLIHMDTGVCFAGFMVWYYNNLIKKYSVFDRLIVR